MDPEGTNSVREQEDLYPLFPFSKKREATAKSRPTKKKHTGSSSPLRRGGHERDAPTIIVKTSYSYPIWGKGDREKKKGVSCGWIEIPVEKEHQFT